MDGKIQESYVYVICMCTNTTEKTKVRGGYTYKEMGEDGLQGFTNT